MSLAPIVNRDPKSTCAVIWPVSYTSTVTPRPDFPTEVEVVLKTAEQIRAESIPARLESDEGHVLVRFEGGRFRNDIAAVT